MDTETFSFGLMVASFFTGCGLCLIIGHFNGRRVERRKCQPALDAAYRVLQSGQPLNRLAAKVAGDN